MFARLKQEIRRLWRKLTKKQKSLKYDATQLTKVVHTSQGPVEVPLGISPAANAERKKILQTKLEYGDSYQVGPSATAHLAPEGKAGKAWVAKRIEAANARRAAHQAKLHKRAAEIMLMSEQELIDSGVKAKVDAFLKESKKELDSLGSFSAQPNAPAPSSKPAERVGEAFQSILEGSGVPLEVAEMVAAGELRTSEAQTESAPLKELTPYSQEQQAEFLRQYLNDKEKGGNG